MSRGRSSTRLARSIVEQASRHPGLRESATQASGGVLRDKDYLLASQLEVDDVTRLQASAVAQRLRDHDLALGAYPSSHTR
jgi:hypothetical protein